MSTSAVADGRLFIDKHHPEAFRALSRTAEAARAAAADAGLERILVELVNLRVSQINGCAYCLDRHTEAALREGETTRRLGVLAAWRDTQLFTPAERAALALAEAATNVVAPSVRAAATAGARDALTDEQISAVLWIAVCINAFNRVSIMSGHPVRPLA
ncbi:carboxymuconolactone decarboxylase family protein [Streptomyces bauhiniae]|uniref:carboxymuconolactone decarboxylase family protein n=1 Tax=Streptomyces bauhiniae TaxID=2340725 RepID=UPI0035DA4A23